jgi:actin-related protein 4
LKYSPRGSTIWLSRRFASGKGSALILDVGEDVTSIVPIYDGFVMRKGKRFYPRLLNSIKLSPKAIQKQPIGGSIISTLVLSYLRSVNQQPPFSLNPNYLIQRKEAVPMDQPAKSILR